MERHVLVVFPHPDDEAYVAGGTIRLLTDRGVPVICMWYSRTNGT